MPALTPGGPAPYTTAVSVITGMDAFRDRGLGTPVTAEVLTRAGVKETIANRTILSMKQLGLLDENGKPSEQFEELRLTRSDEEYRVGLQEWLRGVYADVLQYTNPSDDHPSKVADAFRGYEPAGQRAAMAGLLVGLWRYSGLPVVDPNSGREQRTERRARPAPSSRKPASPTRSQSGSSGHSSKEANLEISEGGLPPGLVGLLHQIPRAPDGWTVGRRQEFMNAFEAVLSFSVPIVSDDAAHTSCRGDEDAGEEDDS